MRGRTTAALWAAFLIMTVWPFEGGTEERKASSAPSSDPSGCVDTLNLECVLHRALANNPSIVAAQHRVAAAEARVLQAGLLPNPELELESENFGGSDDLAGYNAAETTVVLSQKILLGGKRSRRREVAESEVALAKRDLEVMRLDTIAAATEAYYLVLAAQQGVVLANELLDVAEQFSGSVEIRVAAGKVSPIEATRASIEVAQTRIALARAERGLQGRLALLAATWGASAGPETQVVGDLPEPAELPTQEWLREHLLASPEIVRAEEKSQRQAFIADFERSIRIPDLTISAGPRRFEETGQSAWVAGISLAIPIFDRNQGERQAASYELEVTRYDAQAVRVAQESKLTATFEKLRAVTVEVSSLSREIVPAAESAFGATETGYLGGKLGFLDVLDAQRALFDARSMLLAGRQEYAVTRTALERLVGRSIELPPMDQPTSEGGV